MKAKILQYPKGLCDENHTFYRLELHPENKEDNKILQDLNKHLVVWVSPNTSKKGMSWWGKK